MARVHPEIMRVIPLILAELKETIGLRAQVVSGHRSLAQQRTLYAAYRRGTGGRAAPPGQSAHNFGLAIDVLIIPPKADVTDKWAWATKSWAGRRAYRRLHSIARRYGLANIVAEAPDDPFHLQVPGWRNLVPLSRRT